MRPSIGVTLELAALGAVAGTGYYVPSGPVRGMYILVFEALATYLVHCPAHYFLGRVLGIRFTMFRFGKTTLARTLPRRYSRLAGAIPIMTLKADRGSLSKAGADRSAAMYASGTVASVLSAFVVAVLVTPGAPLTLAAAAWALALGYLAFDVVFSPRSGDLMRARAARARSAAEPVQSEERNI